MENSLWDIAKNPDTYKRLKEAVYQEGLELKLPAYDGSGIRASFTFDDVAIVPKPSFFITSRDDISVINSRLFQNREATVINAAMTFFADDVFVKKAAQLQNLIVYNVPRVGLSLLERLEVAKTYRKYTDATAFFTIGTANAEEEVKVAADLEKNENFIPSIDIANGTTYGTISTLELLRSYGVSRLSVGNVGSFEEAYALIQVLQPLELEQAFIKVGIGPGAACTTRITTGVGIGQLSAVDQVVAATKIVPSFTEYLVIADGGVRKPADYVKAMAVGADMVMMGKYILTKDAFTLDKIECPEGDNCYFHYYGMASRLAKKGSNRYVEGSEVYIPLNDETLENRLQGLYDGLRSSMSYVAALTLWDYQRLVEFSLVTQASQKEAEVVS